MTSIANSDRSEASPAQRSLTLAELIDLELALAADRDEPLDELDARDAPLAEHVADLCAELPERADEAHTRGRLRTVLRAWLHSMQPGSGDSFGRRFTELAELTAVTLFAAGALSGALTIGGWLLQGTGTPINVAVFWPAVIGSQLALLIAFATLRVALPLLRRAPGLRAIERLTGSVSAALPWLTLRILSRIASADAGETQRRLGELRALDWLYRPLRVWLMAALTQSFAIGFNLGALAAFVAIPTLDDPAFGWRSRLLDDAQVYTLAHSVALPWRGWLSEAVPTREQVRATRYSSIAPRFAPDASDSLGAPRPRTASPWAVWWPFLMASLLAYGLLPRFALWLIARVALRRGLARAPRRHAQLDRLLERLTRLGVDTRARSPESGPPRASAHGTADAAPRRDTPLDVLCWDGVPAPDAALRERLREAGFAVRSLARVGGVDCDQDARALAALERSHPDAGQICLLVEAWEPPVGDYLDFVRALRAKLGAERPLFVLLYASGDAKAGSRLALYTEQWQIQLEALGDPWIRLGRMPGAST